MPIEMINTIIAAGVPAIVTLITFFCANRTSKKHSAKQSILQMILEDKVAVLEHKLPENHQLILDEFDSYQQNGGNSYVHEKVAEYEDWLKTISNTNKERSKNGKG